MKIQAKQKNMRSVNMSVPVDGVVTIDANGQVEVSDKAAALLLTNPRDWGKVETAAKHTKITKPKTTKDDEGKDEGNAETEPTPAEVVEAIKAMNREELAEFAKASDYPESIIEKLNVEGKEKAFSTWVVKMYQDSLNK